MSYPNHFFKCSALLLYKIVFVSEYINLILIRYSQKNCKKFLLIVGNLIDVSELIYLSLIMSDLQN